MRGVILHEESHDRPFGFHRTFGPHESQVDVFRAQGVSLVNAVMGGENAAVIAYGQTGSGKTFTMLGPPHPSTMRPDYRGPHRGLAPRVCELLFESIARLGSRFEVRVSVTFLEIYNERVFDLLLPAKKHVKVRLMDASAWVPATVVPCTSAMQIMAVFDRGLRNRATGRTEANDASSRSHAIMQVMVKSTDLVSRKQQVSMLQLADLAGSESIAETKATGARLVEAQHINTSLMTLSAVCKALGTPKRRRPVVPYRNSVLTTVLRSSFGGNSRTSIIVTVSPAADSAKTTLRSLRFGSSAAMVKNTPKVDRRVDYSLLRRNYDSLQTDIAGQEMQLANYRAMLKKLARAAAAAFATRSITAAQLAAMRARHPMLKVLMPGAVLTRFLPKGVILRILTFAGGIPALRMGSTSSSLYRVVRDERLWRVLCRLEIDGFTEGDLTLPKGVVRRQARAAFEAAVAAHDDAEGAEAVAPPIREVPGHWVVAGNPAAGNMAWEPEVGAGEELPAAAGAGGDAAGPGPVPQAAAVAPGLRRVGTGGRNTGGAAEPGATDDIERLSSARKCFEHYRVFMSEYQSHINKWRTNPATEELERLRGGAKGRVRLMAGAKRT